IDFVLDTIMGDRFRLEVPQQGLCCKALEPDHGPAIASRRFADRFFGRSFGRSPTASLWAVEKRPHTAAGDGGQLPLAPQTSPPPAGRPIAWHYSLSAEPLRRSVPGPRPWRATGETEMKTAAFVRISFGRARALARAGMGAAWTEVHIADGLYPPAG